MIREGHQADQALNRSFASSNLPKMGYQTTRFAHVIRAIKEEAVEARRSVDAAWA